MTLTILAAIALLLAALRFRQEARDFMRTTERQSETHQ